MKNRLSDLSIELIRLRHLELYLKKNLDTYSNFKKKRTFYFEKLKEVQNKIKKVDFELKLEREMKKNEKSG